MFLGYIWLYYHGNEPVFKTFWNLNVATLKDISEELGLSVATVSRALNGFPEVSEKTRELVEQTARRMNYRPNRAAQKLVSGRSGMVGMLVPLQPGMSAESSLVEVIMGLSARLAERDIDLVMQVILDEDPVAPYRRMISKNTLDGFILNAPQVSDPRIALLQQAKVPFVVHGRIDDDPTHAFYDLDNADAAAQAVNLLADLGHQRIAFINGPESAAFANQRTSGFNAAMRTRMLSLQADFLSYGENTRASGYMRALSLLALPPDARPTALLCASTALAHGVLRAAGDRGLSVPKDLSIICHDDLVPVLTSDDTNPPLTVTKAALSLACAPLADKLIALLNGASPVEQQTTERAELIVRQSTGPAPRSIGV